MDTQYKSQLESAKTLISVLIEIAREEDRERKEVLSRLSKGSLIQASGESVMEFHLKVLKEILDSIVVR